MSLESDSLFINKNEYLENKEDMSQKRSSHCTKLTGFLNLGLGLGIGKRDGPAGRRSGAQRKTGLVGERQLQPYAPHGVKRNN